MILPDPGAPSSLSGRVTLDPLRAFVVPSIGGLLFGLVTAFIARRRGREVDPIEANALHGGRMSMRGSLIVALQTIWSSGVGASVGLEAGYTQIASGIASAIGRSFRLRRSDMRVLIGCGAAAAIAGAFGAPLGGAFYGFELIIGSYSIASLAPIREKGVLQILDGLVGTYEGGPGNWNKTFATWNYQSLLFATDPVALDQVGWEILDAKRAEMGLPRISAMGVDTGVVDAAGKPYPEQFHHRQPQHVPLAATLGLGVFNPTREKIKHTKVELGS